jgi:hypothetical protein
MASITASLRAGMFDDYQLPSGHVVADLGGSDGSVLVKLLDDDTDHTRRGILFDRATTVHTARLVLAAAGLRDRVDVVGGDFFASVPRAHVYVLAYILHDWSDAECCRILASIEAAAHVGARVVIIEGVVPHGDAPHLTKTIDLTMLAMMTGKERSEEQYRDLLDVAGFDLDRVVETGGPFSILEATLR